MSELTVQDEPPPPPPRRFSQDAFKLLASLGKFTEEEYEGCIRPVEPTAVITVDVSAEVDAAINQVLFR